MSRKEIREVFKRNRGAATRLAESIGKSKTTVSFVLRGRAVSRDVLEAARKMAEDLAAKDGAVA